MAQLSRDSLFAMGFACTVKPAFVSASAGICRFRRGNCDAVSPGQFLIAGGGTFILPGMMICAAAGASPLIDTHVVGILYSGTKNRDHNLLQRKAEFQKHHQQAVCVA